MARIFFERPEAPEDIWRWFSWLDQDLPSRGRSGDCVPPMDVIETPTTIEIVVDLPGVAADTMTVAIREQLLLVAGVKRPSRCRHHEAAFHLAERSFGRFARVVRLSSAFDGSQATARLSAGELRVVLPRLAERRGHELRIRIDAE